MGHLLRSISFLLILGLNGCSAPHRPVEQQIYIDGTFSDWPSAEPKSNNGFPGLTLQADGYRIYLLLEFEEPVHLQELPKTLLIKLRASGGSAADVLMELSPAWEEQQRGWRRGARVSVASADGKWIPSLARHVDWHQAPTTRSKRFEVSIPRSRFFTDAHGLSGRIGWRIGTESTWADHEESIELVAANSFDERAKLVSLSVPPGTLRVLSWNVSEDDFLNHPDAYRSIFTVISPHIVILDEAPAKLTQSELLDVLPAQYPWSTLIGSTGGRQRVVIASRVGKQQNVLNAAYYPKDTLEFVFEHARGGTRRDLRNIQTEGIPTAAAVLKLGPIRLGIMGFDLQCCGTSEQFQDAFRVRQVKALRGLITEYLLPHTDAIIVAGDANLVGSDRPLQLWQQPLTQDRALTPVMVRSLQRDNVTTYVQHIEFQPGRLDYILHDNLIVTNSFVFDTQDIYPNDLAAIGLSPDTSEIISSHLPLVVDFAWANRSF